MTTTTAFSLYIPMIYILYSFNTYCFFQLAKRAAEGNNQLIVYINFNIGCFIFIHNFIHALELVNKQLYPAEHISLSADSPHNSSSKTHEKMASCLCADCSCEMTRTAARFKRKITFNTR